MSHKPFILILRIHSYCNIRAQMMEEKMRIKKMGRQGQSLVEYLIIVAVMGVATMGIVRLLGHTVSAKFAQVVQSLQGKTGENIEFNDVEKKHYEQKDMSDFMRGSRKGK